MMIFLFAVGIILFVFGVVSAIAALGNNNLQDFVPSFVACAIGLVCFMVALDAITTGQSGLRSRLISYYVLSN